MTLSKSVFIACLAAGLTVFSITTFAGGSDNDATATKEKPKFETVDANRDGEITTEEAKGSWLAEVFSQVDTNQDGLINRLEYESAAS